VLQTEEVKVQSTKKAVSTALKHSKEQTEVFRRKLAFKTLFKEQCQHGSSHLEQVQHYPPSDESPLMSNCVTEKEKLIIISRTDRPELSTGVRQEACHSTRRTILQ